MLYIITVKYNIFYIGTTTNTVFITKGALNRKFYTSPCRIIYGYTSTIHTTL